MQITSDDHPRWRFLTNHAHVLETVARDPTSRLRDIARTVGITERTAAKVVNDLGEAGYLTKIRDGRRNRYVIHEELPLRHRQRRHQTVGELLRFLEVPAQPRPRKKRRPAIE